MNTNIEMLTAQSIVAVEAIVKNDCNTFDRWVGLGEMFNALGDAASVTAVAKVIGKATELGMSSNSFASRLGEACKIVAAMPTHGFEATADGAGNWLNKVNKGRVQTGKGTNRRAIYSVQTAYKLACPVTAAVKSDVEVSAAAAKVVATSVAKIDDIVALETLELAISLRIKALKVAARKLKAA